ncbi:MAG: AsnC family protein [Solirubrobacterales bacterium]
MALSDDQKAILRLLSQRGAQGYEDLSALLGVSPDEIHSRAKAAAAELEAEGIPAPVVPEPGGGGGSDSPSVAKDGEAPPGESLPPTPAPPVAPKVEAPRPATPETKPIPKHEHHTVKEDAHRLKLLEGRGLWALLAGAAIVVIFVVLVLTGGGDDGGDTTTTSSSNAPSGETVAALEKSAEGGSKEVTKASLKAVDGRDAVGVAVFGRVKKTLALQVAAEGLEPAEGEDGYTIWLAASPQKMLPLASTEVGEDGRIGAQVTVPVEVLAYLANETFGQIVVTRTDETQLKASLAKATKEKNAPAYTGDEVLNGEVTGPIVGAANREKAE